MPAPPAPPSPSGAPRVPGAAAPKGPATNHVGKLKAEYGGSKSTLCSGCGHDAITSAIIRALWEGGVNPYKVAKMSGIGCSSKTGNYFLNKSWGFNSVHGRMPSVATGALVANGSLIGVGVSGDGDTASIGMGQFVHCVRRNLPLTYIVANNGVYGLTKGQFSATADKGSLSKYKVENKDEAIDLCGLALELGCTFVARSFSADPKQLVPILKAALRHRGTAVIDVISPCVTFNNHVGSTKSYDWGRQHEDPVHEVGFVNEWEAPPVDYDEGEMTVVAMPDGGTLTLRKLERDHDVRDREAAKDLLARSRTRGEFLTGVFYVDPEAPNLHDRMNMVDEPLVTLGQERTRLTPADLEDVMDSFR